MSRFLPLCAAILVLLSALPHSARAAEPTLEVHPARSRCVVPFEIIGTGLEPSRAVEAPVTVGGTVTGRVTGVTGPDGRLRVSIPLILLPCEAGGPVTVSISVDGVPGALTATFEIAEPIVPPPTATATSAVLSATPIPPETGGGSEAAAVAGQGAPWALLMVVAMAGGGMLATWATRPRGPFEYPDDDLVIGG